MGDIKVLEYSIGKGRGRGWSVTFTSPINKDVDYNGPHIGFKQIHERSGKEYWVVFEVNNKTVKVGEQSNEYIYEADFIGHRPDTTIELEKVDFEWVDNKDTISEAHKQACWT